MKIESYVGVSRLNDVFENKKITSVSGLQVGGDCIVFNFDNNESFKMYHSQNCCESVEIEDINGDKNMQGAIFYELLEKQCDESQLSEFDDSYTWTFYTIRTSIGYLDVRWYGTSNGYYSENVDLEICISDN